MVCNQSCQKCKELTRYGFLPEMEKYFGMYKPNNWWTYTNQSNSINDSIYVYDYSEIIKKDTKQQCIEFPRREFKLSSNFLLSSSEPILGAFFANNKCCEDYFSVSNSNFGVNVKMDEATESNPQNGNVNESLILLDSLNINSFVFKQVICVEGFNSLTYFAPNVGMVKYITNGDTFLIKNWLIQ